MPYVLLAIEKPRRVWEKGRLIIKQSLGKPIKVLSGKWEGDGVTKTAREVKCTPKMWRALSFETYREADDFRKKICVIETSIYLEMTRQSEHHRILFVYEVSDTDLMKKSRKKRTGWQLNLPLEKDE